MTTGHPVSAEPARPPRRRTGRRPRPDTLALSILSLLIVVTTVAHDAGKILPETKLDLVVDPGRFLARATFFWDASADFGRIQNQAVGYLWPMGPFYYLGHAAGIPGWLTQRLWISLLVVLALWGMYAVLRNLRVGTPISRVVGAATYALAPSFLATMIYQSAAQIPVTALPWIMAPLLKTREDGTTPRSAVWRSALAVACIGAVNGAAAIIVLAVPVLWFATRRRPLQHWRMAATWAFASLLGMAWWLGPLLLQGRYGYAFTAYTERADLTTATQSATEVLRGTGSWLSYLVVDGHPLVDGARALAIDRSAVIATLLVAGVGLAGLVRSDLRERTWLIVTLLIGVVATGLAFVGPVSGWAAEPVRGILDGALAPFRNVQKFEPLLRFALAVGVAHLLAVARLPAWTRIGRSTRAPQFALIAVLVAVLLPVARAQQSGLSPDGSFSEIPQYWEKAVSWVDRNGDSRRTLLVPSSSFGEYTWGRPLDEPIQALSNEPWAARNIIPLGGSGPTRLLDELDRRMVNRQLGPGTSEILARMGVRYLLVRNDLDRARILSPAPALLRTSLEGTPNLERVAAFGPEVGGSLLGDQLTTDFGPAANDGLRAIEVWEVRTPTNRITTYDAASSVAVNGGPESLFPLADVGLLPGRAALLTGSESTIRAATWAATDVTRRRDATFAGVRDDVSYTLTPDEDAPGTDRAPIDRLAPEFDPQRSTADLRGAATITSSSYSLSDQTRYPGTQPWAAFDDDPTSAWRPTTGRSPVGAWLEVGFDEPTTVPSVTIERPPGEPARVTEVLVTTDAGQRTAKFTKGDRIDVALPPGATSTVRITIADSIRAGAGYGSPGLSTVELAGVDLQRPVVPVTARPSSTTEQGAPVLSFDRARTDRTNRLKSDEDAQLDRSFTLDAPAGFDLTLTGSPRPGAKLDALLRELRTSLGATDAAVQASSVWQDLPAFGGYAAHDDDLTTSWVAAVDDPDPTLTIDWGNPVTLSRIRIQSPGFPGEPIGAVRLESPSGVRTVDISSSGVGSFAPLTTTAVKIRLATPGKRPFTVAQPEVRAISEVSFNAPIPPARTIDDDQEIGVGCGDGPRLRIDGTVVETSVATTWDAVRHQEPALVVACDPSIDLAAGAHRIVSTGDAAFSIDGVNLDPGGREPAAPARTTRVDRWDTDARTIEVAAGGDAIIATTENANPGWVATYEGKELRPIVVDGWRQGWELPEGRSGLVELRFQPGILYRGLLAGGSVLLLMLVLLNVDAVRNLLPRRRTTPLLLEPSPGFGTPVVAVISVVAVAAVAGPVCLLVPVLFLARRANVTTLVIGTSLTVAGAMALRDPLGSTIAATGTFSPLAQTAAALAIGAVAVSLLRPTPELAPDAATGSTATGATNATDGSTSSSSSS